MFSVIKLIIQFLYNRTSCGFFTPILNCGTVNKRVVPDFIGVRSVTANYVKKPKVSALDIATGKNLPIRGKKIKKAAKIPPVTPKQLLFCMEYVINWSPSKSALAAGYSSKYPSQIGNDLLKKPQVINKIAELMKDRIVALRIDANFVLKAAKQLFDRCMEIEEVLDKKGQPIGVFKFDSAGAAKALEIIGKHIDVRAFDKPEIQIDTVIHNIMPVPTADSADSWEAIAQEQQANALSQSH